MVLLDLGLLVVDMERRHHAVGDDPGPEAARGSPGDPSIEDQLDMIRPAKVEVLPDDLLEEHAAGERAIKNLRERELHLKHREVIAISGGAVPGVEGVWQDLQPLPEEPIDRRASAGQGPSQCRRYTGSSTSSASACG